jgi:hypothetical protein
MAFKTITEADLQAFRSRRAPHALPAGFNDVDLLNALVSFLDTEAVDPGEVVVTTRAIEASDSGKTFYLGDVDGFTCTLPAPALGLKYRFIVKLAPTEASYIIDTGAANIMYGMIETSPVDDAARAVTAQQKITFVVDVALIGDWVELQSDGTNWYVSGMVNVIEAATVAQS